jgi:hypothetical protein
VAAETSIIDLDERPDLADRTTAPQRGRHRLPEPERRMWSTRPWLLALIAIAVAVVTGGLALLIPNAFAREPANPPADGRQNAEKTDGQGGPVAAPTPRVPQNGTVNVDFDGFFAWALLDEHGQIAGSKNVAARTWAGSIVKVWIVADFLRLTAEQGKEPSERQLAQASKAIRDSDDTSANALYKAAGETAQLRRMIRICGLTDTTIEGDRWRSVRMSSRDAVRLGACVADGRAAGDKWTDWVRREMTMVRGSLEPADQPHGGRWGIIDGLPAQLRDSGVGIINGWVVVESEGEWHVNCLAVADRWSMAVMTRYSADRDLRYGAEACKAVAAQLVPSAA